MTQEKQDLINHLTITLAKSDYTITSIKSILELTLYDYEITKINCTELSTTDGITTKNLFEYFAIGKLASGVKKNSLANYWRAVNELSTYIGKEINLIGEDDILKYFAYLRNVKKLSPTTLSNRQMYLNSFFDYIYKRKKIGQNPIELMEFIRPKVKLKKILSDVEIEQIVIACQDHKYKIALIYILLYTGIRVTELCNITLGDIDFNESTLVIHGKGDTERLLPINSKTMVRLHDYLKTRKDIAQNESEYIYDVDVPLFPIIKGKVKKTNSRNIERIINDIADKSGVYRLHPHLFRATFATKLALQGKDSHVISLALGHKSLSTLKRYVLLSNQELKKLLQ